MLKRVLLSLIFMVFTQNTYTAFTLPAGNINFSGCTLTAPQNLEGNLVAHNAQFTSLTINGLANLSHTTITEKLCVAGELDCNHCTLEAALIEGPATLHHTTIKNALETTGSLECKHCTIGSLKSNGELSLQTAEIAGSAENTEGLTRARNSKFTNLTLVGGLKGKDVSCDNLSVTGNTSLAASTIKETAMLVGTTKCTECVFSKLVVRGTTRLAACHTQNTAITGKLDAETCSARSFMITAEIATFTSCAIDILYVQKCQNQKTPTIYINGPKSPNSDIFIKKIMCQDPCTLIIYGPTATPAGEIIGTSRITHAQKN